MKQQLHQFIGINHPVHCSLHLEQFIISWYEHNLYFSFLFQSFKPLKTFYLLKLDSEIACHGSI